MPSTPVDSPFDLTANLDSPDRQGPYFLRHQQIKNVLSTAEILEQQNQRLQKSFKMLNISTPDSSQTDHSSDDVSPKIQRRRKNLVAAAAEDEASKRHNLPKLSISLEHETTSHQLPSPTINPPPRITPDNLNKRVLKSASAIDLSLKIMPNYNASEVPKVNENIRKAKLKLETNFANEPRPLKHMGSDSNLEIDSTFMRSLSSGGNGSSTASSREVSPSRDSPLINNLKPP